MTTTDPSPTAVPPRPPHGGRPAPRPGARTARRAVVAGLLVLAFVEGFEYMAVATAMPAVAADLHAVGAIALAFAVPLAVSVVARSVAGGSMDRRGPGPGFRAGIALLVVGLVGSALAPTMPVLLAARGVQGVGMGLVGVGLYVVVGREFPAEERTRVFTLLTLAWVVPALVGPGIAGVVTDRLGWRWVFGAVVPVVVVAYAMVRPALRRPAATPHAADETDVPAPDAVPHGAPDDRPATGRRAVLWSVPTSAGLLAASVAGQATGVGGALLLGLSLAVVVVSATRLLPRGTWTGRRGLPSVVGSRSLLGAAYFGAEAYVPLVLHDRHGLTLTAAGSLLTLSALAWSGAAWLGTHVPWLAASPLRRVGSGVGLVVVGLTGTLAVVLPAVPVWAVAVAWTVAGAGQGLSNPTFATLVLDAGEGAQGVASAAMQTNDVLVQTLVLAVGAAVFADLVASAQTAAFTVVLGLAVAVAVAAAAQATRIGRDPRVRTPALAG